MTTTSVCQLWTNIAAALLTLAALVPFSDSANGLWFIAGLVYAIFFEYFYHRLIGHSNRFPLAAEKHRQHHKVWRGENALTTDRSRLELSEDWYFFPIALLGHFAVGKTILGWFPWEVLVAFTLFYLQFEIFHWATHIEDNCIDEVILEWPVVRAIRLKQIAWHLHHHELPRENYNFTAPYPGDILFGTDTADPGRKTWQFQ